MNHFRSPDELNWQLYIHVPFCEKKCHYCDFRTWEAPSLAQKQWLESISIDLELRAPALEKQVIRTVFIGGGTPSFLSVSMFRTLVARITENYNCNSLLEWTVECNPSSLTREKLDLFHELGIGRLSLGVQSFDEKELQLMGRVHNPDGARRALQLVAEDGRFAFSGDLIFGLPGQSLEQFLFNLREMMSYNPDHMSFYGLTIEKGTRFDEWNKAGSLFLPEAEQYNQLYLQGIELIESQGYQRYEVSNFSKTGKESLHNQGYWDRRPYFGFGPGAHSFDSSLRYWCPDTLESYRAWCKEGCSLDACERDTLGVTETLDEIVFLSLRQTKGLALNQLVPFCKTKQTASFRDILPEAFFSRWKQHLEIEDARIALKGEGWLLLDEIAAELLAAL